MNTKMNVIIVLFFFLRTHIMTECNNIPEIAFEWTDMTTILEDLSGVTSYHITVHCTLNRGCDLLSRMDILTVSEKANAPLVSEECDAIRSGNSRWTKYWTIDHRILINDTSIFDSMVCSYRTPDGRSYASKNQVVPPFVFCPPQSTDCASTRCKTNGLERSFCLWKPDGDKNQCQRKFDAAWCRSDETKLLYHPKRYCPVDKVGLCEALAEDPVKVWYMTTESKPCISLASTPISYNGEPLVHGQEFLVEPERKYIRFDCPHGSPFYDVQVGIMRGGEYPRAGAVCRGALNLSIDEDGRPLVQESWKIAAIMPAKPRFELGVINFQHINLTLINTNESGYAEIKCNLHNGPIGFKNNFRMSHWWTRTNSNTTKIGLDHKPDFSDLAGASYWLKNVTDPDEYQCHVEITYMKCSPYWKVSVRIDSNTQPAEYPSKTTQDPRSKTNERARGADVAIVIGIIMAVIGLTIP